MTIMRYTLDEITNKKVKMAKSKEQNKIFIIAFILIVIPLVFLIHDFGMDFAFVFAFAWFVWWKYQHRFDKLIQKYDKTLEAWNYLLVRSHPDTLLMARFPLQQNECIFYSEAAIRYEERRTGQVIDTQTRTKNAIPSAIVGDLLFGPVGAIVGGGMARKSTKGTTTDIYNVVPIDHGEIVITNSRFVFMGARNTVELPIEKVLSYSAVPESNRILVEYNGRQPGESYEVNVALFSMCMARRANNKQWQIPLPPPPLSSDVNVQVVSLLDTQPLKLEN